MGGNAFKEYDTPRLTHAQYEDLLRYTHQKLVPLFEGLTTPPTDPGKDSHGDLDVIAHSPCEGTTNEVVAKALAAKAVIPGRPTTNFLVPLGTVHAQVDVHVCPKEQWELQVFLHSYSRLGHMLSKMILRFGLYLDLRGLYTWKPTPSVPSFLISSSLRQILALLHLPYEVYLEGFDSREALYEWMEEAQVASIPLKHGWRASGVKKSDAIMWEWHVRRLQDGPRVEIDQEATRVAFLKQAGLMDAFTGWKEGVEAQAAKVAAEKAKADEIKAEVRRRMERIPARGKDKKLLAKSIRAQVEDYYAALRIPLPDSSAGPGT